MKKFGVYIILFIWVTLFMYLYNMVMPKGILYLIIAIPLLLISCSFILKLANNKTESTK